MSPILVRPVREQLEHDRIIRLLQSKFRRKFEAEMNPGSQQNAAAGTGPVAVYPDLVLFSQERGRRLQAVVEVETGESVNHLEALAQWAHFARLRAAFHLYVPSSMVDVARRLCEDNAVTVGELWAYHAIGDDVRFTLIERSGTAAVAAPSRPASKTTASQKVQKATTAAKAKPSKGAKVGALASKPPASKAASEAAASKARTGAKAKREPSAKAAKAKSAPKASKPARKSARPAAKRR